MRKRSIKEKVFTEYIGKSFSIFCGLLIIIVTLAIIFFIGSKGIQSFIRQGMNFIQFVFTDNWNPMGTPETYGILAFVVGSTLVSIGALVISAPIAIALAIFVNVISKKLGDRFIKPSLEILVGIPSVVYGWVGLMVLVPLVKNIFGGVGFSLLAGILVLSLMILPTIATLSIDAINAVPKIHIEASYGLGATRWQTIKKVIVPGAKSGILTGVILGLARAFGEALAVQMVIGNTVKIPKGISDSTSTLTSILTMDITNTVSGSAWNDALWSMALILLIISFIFILIVRIIEKRGEVK
ncbi:MAG: phosphate ABC transporter permease subunit PstC [Clostridium sp.]|uniref:phosphate ABC transporter permease subunit PstC n=1 Tax=Clostridium sp. TaxID=1506 RepID=UPI003F3ECF01